jgi:hypothetical protein
VDAQVLRREQVDDLGRLIEVTHQHGEAVRRERIADVLRVRKLPQPLLDLEETLAEERLVRRDEDRRGVRIVFGLREQLGGRVPSLRALVRDHDGLRRPEESVDPDVAVDELLRQRRVDSARTADFVDRRDPVRPICHRGDRLRPADPVDLLDAADASGGHHDRGRIAVPVGRRAQHELGNAGDARRHGSHEDGRRKRRPSRGGVEPDALDGTEDLADLRAVPVDHPVLGPLRLVEDPDPVGRRDQGVDGLRVDGVGKRVALVDGHRDALWGELAAVELPRVLDQRLVPALPDVLEDPADDRRLFRVAGRVPAGAFPQHIRELFACVDNLERHGEQA